MSLKLQTVQCLKILSVQGGAQARLSLHLSKCHIVGNHMSRLIWPLFTVKANRGSREFRKGGGGPGNFHFSHFSCFTVVVRTKKTIATCDFPVGWGSETPDPPMLSRLYSVH